MFNYIDPGSGSMLFQLMLAGILGVLTFFKNIKNFILSIFGKKNDKSDSEIDGE
jgi:hypothetical protein